MIARPPRIWVNVLISTPVTRINGFLKRRTALGKSICGLCGRLEQLPEFRDGKPCVAHDAAHSERIHGILARDREDALSIGHNDVLAFPSNSEPSLLQRPHCVTVVNARELRHLDRDVDLANAGQLQAFDRWRGGYYIA